MKSTVLNELMNCSVIELAQYSSVIAARLSSIDVNGGMNVKVNSKSSKNTNNNTNKDNDKDKYAIKHDITPKFIVEDKVVKLDGFYGKKAFQAIKEVVNTKTGVEYEKGIGWTFKTKKSANDFAKSELIITAKEANDIWERTVVNKSK